MIQSRRFGPGEVIIQENNEGETAYIIDRGRVEVTKELGGKKVHLAYLGVGETFGEMSIIDEKPRSATVSAVEETVVREIHRDDFSPSFQSDPQFALTLVKVLFERLRRANVTILQLQEGQTPLATGVSADAGPHDQPTVDLMVILEGLTQKAIRSLPDHPYQIQHFPFMVGRKSADPLAHNDLMISDFEPFQISRHHIAIIQDRGRIGLLDRGSRLGSLLDGEQLGGWQGNPKPIYLQGSGGVLILGNVHSPYKYKLVLKTQVSETHQEN